MKAWDILEMTFETIRTRKSFSLIPHESIVLSSVKILPKMHVSIKRKIKKIIHANHLSILSSELQQDGPVIHRFLP